MIIIIIIIIITVITFRWCDKAIKDPVLQSVADASSSDIEISFDFICVCILYLYLYLYFYLCFCLYLFILLFHIEMWILSLLLYISYVENRKLIKLHKMTTSARLTRISWISSRLAEGCVKDNTANIFNDSVEKDAIYEQPLKSF